MQCTHTHTPTHTDTCAFLCHFSANEPSTTGTATPSGERGPLSVQGRESELPPAVHAQPTLPPHSPCPSRGGLCLQGKESTSLPHGEEEMPAVTQPGLQAAPGAPSANQDRLAGSDPTSSGPAALCPQPQRPHVRHGGKEHPPSVWGLRPRRRVNHSTTGRLFLRPQPPPPCPSAQVPHLPSPHRPLRSRGPSHSEPSKPGGSRRRLSW